MPAKSLRIAEFESLNGQELGVSDWYTVTQEAVSEFARVTRDEQWIHVDAARAERESPFRTTIAHGYFTLALAPHLMSQIWTVTDARLAINYGLNKLRFPAPVPVGKSLRLRVSLLSIEPIPGGIQITVNMVIEVEGNRKPVCVAEALFRYYR
ncbi:MAG: MaoC family dehydratase [Candidatus Hydrogenedentes bacterium]|nr:MaoC family dehydratase [Candidatus Hydrogenedentota bacterium]